MRLRRACILFFLCVISNATAQFRKFPSNFTWGIASSAYQIEGGWNEDGKGESIWDRYTHKQPEKIIKRKNADVSSDSYHFWKDDVQLLRDLGVQNYRFSISWSRILPTGLINNVNIRGIKYYNNLINELIRFNITPIVTIYHWDLPQKLQDLGGWTSSKIISIFRDYSKVLFDNFGDRVKTWITINEPWQTCVRAYGMDYSPPAVNFSGVAEYMCGHNILRAHTEVVHLYRNVYKYKQKGVIGIAIDANWPEPRTNSVQDREASEMSLQFYVGWMANPIFSRTGNYPSLMINRIDELSRQQGFSKSRLPKFNQTEVERIRGTSDFFIINSYSSLLVWKNDRNNSAGHQQPSFLHDMGIVEGVDMKSNTSGPQSLWAATTGVYKLLNWIKKEYNNPPVYVTDNGIGDAGGTHDLDRIEYLDSYLDSILDAINNGCNVRGYIARNFIDGFEWRNGFSQRYGFHYVDFNHPTKIRIPKASAKVYAKIIKTNMIDRNYRPKPDVMVVATTQHLKIKSKNGGVTWNLNSILFSFVLLVLGMFR